MRGRKTSIVIRMPGERIRDAEGRWTATGEDVEVLAHVAPPASSEVQRQRSYQEERPGSGGWVAGTVLVPRGTPIDVSCRVLVAGAGVIPDGWYKIRAMTHTVKHVRLAVYAEAAG